MSTALTTASTIVTSRAPLRAPATPPTQTIQQPPSNTPNGAWRHPRLDEIARRQDASTFSDRNLRTIIWNAVFLVASFVVPSTIADYIPIPSLNFPSPANYVLPASAILIRLLFLANIVLNAAPLFTGKDNVEDIPLTPSQRAVLGLKPSSAPATPGSQYITPPRYSRSSTPRSGRGSPLMSPQRRSQSPLGQPAASGRSSGSTYSAAASPLLQKAIGGADRGGHGRRSSFGGYSPSRSTADPDSSTFVSAPGTPTPAGGQNKNASVGLNNKWLYERSRGSPGRGIFA